MDQASDVEGQPAVYFGQSSRIDGNVFANSKIGTFNHFRKSNVDRLEDLNSAIGILSPEYDLRKIITLNGKKECKWVLENELYLKWTSRENEGLPLVWVGNAEGSGKTTLATFICQHLGDQPSVKTNNTWVLYYFCDCQENSRNSATSIMKGLIYMLYNKEGADGPLPPVVRQRLQKQGTSLFQPGNIESLWDVFEDLLKTCSAKHIYCIIDGVDECNTQLSVVHFLRKFKQYFTEQNQRQVTRSPDESIYQTVASSSPPPPSSQPAQSRAQIASAPELRVMVLSDEKSKLVMDELESFPRLAMPSLNTETGKADMKEFIDTSAEEVADTLSVSKLKRRETVETIAEALDKSDNQNFLRVSLIRDNLKKMKPNQVKSYLADIPDTVEGMYEQTLLRIPSSQRTHVAMILKWAALAARPLSTLEMVKAVKYSLKKSDFTPKSLNKALTTCHGLLKTQRMQERPGDTIKTIHLVHQSVHEFLTGEQSPLRNSKKLEDFVINKSDAHSELANTCVRYLEESPYFEKSRRVRVKPSVKLKADNHAFFSKHPFLEYSIVHWTLHAKQGNLEKTNYSATFFQKGSTRRKLWWESYWISLRDTFAWKWTTPGKFSLLHLAAFFDIVPLAFYVENSGRLQELLTAADRQGMKPINWATERSCEAMVKFLLKRSEFDEDTLKQAARTGDAFIITMLLERRARILSSPEIARSPSSPTGPSSPFQYFSKTTLGSISNLSKKLDQTKTKEEKTPLSPGIRDYGTSISETPLHIAATCGHDEAVEVLIEATEDLDECTDGGWTALHNAAWFGRVCIVERLIDSGADARAITRDHLTPLHCAVKNSQPAVLECLLLKEVNGERLVDIDATDHFGFTPFHMACRSNKLDIMEILINNGADIEKMMGPGWTPLIWSCIHGQFDVAELLLKRGADFTATWTYFHSEAVGSYKLGPVGLAKAYRQERLASLVESYGGSDGNRLTHDEANILPSAEPAQEEYDLPKTDEIPLFEQEQEDEEEEDLYTVSSANLSVPDESSEENEEEDDSDDDTPLHLVSEADVESVTAKNRQTSLITLGLGIHEEASEDIKVEPVNGESSAKSHKLNVESSRMRGICGVNDGKKVIAAKDEPNDHQEEARPDEVAQSGHEPGAEGKSKQAAEAGLMEAEVDKFAHDVPTDRNNSKSKSPGSLSNVFGRLVPKRTTNKSGSTVGSEKKDPVENADEQHRTILEDGDSFEQEPDNIVESPKQRETGILQRLGPKRGWSWKNEGRGDGARSKSAEVE